MSSKESIEESERWLSVIAGGMLILSSLRRRVGTGALFALGGAALVFRGVVGRDGFLAALRGAVLGRPAGTGD